MFEAAKELINKYFNFLKEKFGEEVGIMYGIGQVEGRYEIDAIVGETSEKVLGLRFFNVKDGVIYDLLVNTEDVTEQIKMLDEKQKKKDIGKTAVTIHYTSENFPIDHDFVFYSKKGKWNKDILHAEMVRTADNTRVIVQTFSLDETLFEMQVQA